MSEGKTFFARALDALMESRMRQANHQVALYRSGTQIDAPNTRR